MGCLNAQWISCSVGAEVNTCDDSEEHKLSNKNRVTVAVCDMAKQYPFFVRGLYPSHDDNSMKRRFVNHRFDPNGSIDQLPKSGQARSAMG